MKNIMSIYKKELRLIFSTWIGYIIIAVFIALTGYFFQDMVDQFARLSAQFLSSGQRGGVFPYNINDILFRYWLGNSSVILLFVIPLLTMRSFSEEKKSGTIEMMMTSPLRHYQLVLGKYLAILTVLVPLIIYSILLVIYFTALNDVPMTVQWGPFLVGLLGLVLLGGAFIALGIFISSMTENQIISALTTFGALLIIWVIGWSSVYSSTGFGEILRRISLNNHYENFAKGVISLSDSIYFILFITFFLILTVSSLGTTRWRGIK